ncbi:Xenotropic and polytropic retrovirus receptor 1, partial [Fragariocoptes setiger]
QTGDDWRIVFRLYRSSLLIIVFISLVGVNIYGWRAHGVNHVLIFELDPRDHLGCTDLLEIAFTFGGLWCISVLLFLWSSTIGIPPLINPLMLNAFMLLYLVNPTRTFHYTARIWLLRCIGRVVSAPVYPVRFCDFWLADQFNSLVPVFLDIEYTSCFYLSTSDLYDNVDRCVVREPKDLILRSIVACLPAWWRFAQCVRRYFDEGRRANPHLLNAGKYSAVWLVVLFSTLTEYTQDNYQASVDNPFFICWILSLVFGSCYTYIWDIKMDWGLGDPKAPKEYAFLREEIIYPVRYYYMAIVEDFVLRFGWTLSVSLTEIGAIPPDLITLVLAPFEVFRRFLWNFLRLENEHLNNCGEFRAVRDISISGQNIDLSALNRILKVMDEPDGLSMFRRKVKQRLLTSNKKRAMANETLDPSVVLII